MPLVADRAALRTNLHDSLVLSRGLDHLRALKRVVAGGLLNVNIFTRLAGPNCCQSVPVIWSCHRDCLDVVVLEKLSHVRILFGLVAL